MATTASAQRIPDTSFRATVERPAFAAGLGPRVCIDEAHRNEHTALGRYAPYAALMRADGFRVIRFERVFTTRTLAACEILVVANAVASENVGMEQWPYPHGSAFTREEVSSVVEWVRGGGAILLVADHAPFAGAAADLGAALGVLLADAWSYATPRGITPELLTRAGGALRSHPIIDGRGEREHIDSVGIWVAGAFWPAEGFSRFLQLPETGTAYVMLGEMGQALAGIPEKEWPRFRMSGWLIGGARRWGAGRIVVLGDGTMCTAQFVGPGRVRVGMNNPAARQNSQFCVNAVRWLSGMLD